MIAGDFAHELGAVLGVDLVVAVAEGQAPLSTLSSRERARVDSFVLAERRDGWLRGRAALKSVLAAQGRGTDTAALRFPHPRLSVSHAGGVAVAVGVAGDVGDVVGVGVDLELDRAPRAETARFFLLPDEQDWLARAQGDLRGAEILRLWTVKEAVFKSDPDNADSGLVDYAVDQPGRHHGGARATRPACPRWFRYCTLRTDDRTLTVAICRDSRIHHASSSRQRTLAA